MTNLSPIMSDSWRECKPPATPLKKSYYHGACAQPLSGKTIGEVLEEETIRFPDRIAFRTHELNEEITTKELKHKADNVAKALLAAKLSRGDLVMADSVTDIDYFAVYYGALQVGMIFMAPIIEVPSEQFVPKLCKMKPRVVFIGRKHYTTSLPIYKQYADSCKPTDVSLVFVNTNDDKDQDGFLQYKEFLDRNVDVTDEEFEHAKQQVSIDDTAVLFPSSGTSRAEDKVACMSHHSLVNMAKFCPSKKYQDNPEADVSSREIVGFLNPFIDDAGAAISPLRCLYNRQLGVMAPPTSMSTPEAAKIFMEFVEKEKIALYAGLPFELIHTMNSPLRDKYDLSTLKSGNLLGQIVSDEAKKSLMKLFPECVTKFGATECFAGLGTSLKYSTKEQRLKTIGMAYPHCEVKLVNDKNTIVPVGEQGEICVRGWSVFKGYFNNPSLTAEAKSLDKNGWYHYGDIGIMDETGHVSYIGRKTDCVRFKHYGDIVYPVKILSVIDTDERIQSSKVIGIQNDERGDDICLFVQPKPGCSITEVELKEMMSRELLQNMCPDNYFIIEEFPRIGARRKIDVNKLKEFAQTKLNEIKSGT